MDAKSAPYPIFIPPVEDLSPLLESTENKTKNRLPWYFSRFIWIKRAAEDTKQQSVTYIWVVCTELNRSHYYNNYVIQQCVIIVNALKRPFTPKLILYSFLSGTAPQPMELSPQNPNTHSPCQVTGLGTKYILAIMAQSQVLISVAGLVLVLV